MYKIAAIIGGVVLMAGVALAGTVTSLGSAASPSISQTIPTASVTVRHTDRAAERRGRANEPGEDVRRADRAAEPGDDRGRDSGRDDRGQHRGSDDHGRHRGGDDGSGHDRHGGDD
jgi:hypothetical protein